jgi:hypothetical protein
MDTKLGDSVVAYALPKDGVKTSSASQ